MSTFNGIGTFYYGRDDVQEDGSFVATRWFVVFLMPLFPLGTERIRNLGVKGEKTTYQVLDSLPMHWRQVKRTLLRCWLLVPLLLFWPFLMLIGIAGVLHAVAGKAATNAFMQQVGAPVSIGSAIYIIVVAWYLIRRARRAGMAEEWQNFDESENG